MRGKFIVFEALDAAGKSTQVDLLVQRLQGRGISVWKTGECTNGPIGRLLRSDYLSGKQTCDEKVINMLMAADRLEHVTAPGGILDHLENGDWVVCDRFVLSSFAYDNYMYRMPALFDGFDYIYNMNKRAIEKIAPDMTIYLDVSVDTCMARLSNRGEKPEVYEKRDKLERIAKTYDIAKMYVNDEKGYNMNIVNIDAEKDVISIANQIMLAVEQQFL